MKELVEFAVGYAKDKQVKYAEARIQTDIENSITLRNGTVDSVSLENYQGIGIRVLVDGSLGFASTNVLTKDAIRKAVDNAISLAKASASYKKDKIVFSEEKTYTDKWEAKQEKPFDDISIDEKIKYLQETDKAILDTKLEIPSRFIVYVESKQKTFFANSDGSFIEGFVPRIFTMGLITVKGSKGVEQEFVEKGGSGGWELVEQWDLPTFFSSRANILGNLAEEAQKPPTGFVDIVLGTLTVGLSVHESSGHPSEADRIMGREAAQAGESFLSEDWLGKQIGNDVVTIIDDPTLENSYGFYKYDAEGIPARPRYLMKNGRINEFLHNRETAGKMGIQSNGAARAMHYDNEPIVRMANTYMLPGDHTFEELIEDIKLGVFINTFGEWNIDDRRYNMRFVGKEAYLIEKGELKGFVKNPILEVTTPAYYSSIDALSKNLKFDAATCGKGDPDQGVPVWHGGPEVRLRNIRLGGIE